MEQTWARHERGYTAYLNLERGLQDNSVKAYMADFAHLEHYGVEARLEPAEITVDHLRQLLLDMQQTGIAVTTQCRLISGWRMFFKWLELEADAADNPAELLPMPSRGRHLPDVLSDADISAIQATFDLSQPDQARNHAMVEVLYCCGLRVSELVGMKLSNIYPDEQGLHIVGKGDKERWVPIAPHALDLLSLYIDTVRCHIQPKRGEENYVFLNRLGTHISRSYVFMFLKEAAHKAGIAKRVSPHSLRHSFATELVQNGADLRAVQEMLGHESITTTEIYTHLTPDILRSTITACHPHYRKDGV